MPKGNTPVVVARGRVLVIAGSDSCGGAGIQADIKTVTAMGGYAATAITALTAQNTEGVFGILDVPAEFIRQQMRLVINDIGVDALKIGMLHTAEVIHAVAGVVKELAKDVPLVLDPVMVAKGGQPLLQKEAVQSLKTILMPLAAVITPNIPEAEILTGHKIHSVEDMKTAAAAIIESGARVVLLKGGHLPGDALYDVLFDGTHYAVFENNRLDTRHTHGTGCTLASAIATGLAKGEKLHDAVAYARRYVFEAIRTAPGFGRGHGPLNHGHTVCLID